MKTEDVIVALFPERVSMKGRAAVPNLLLPASLSKKSWCMIGGMPYLQVARLDYTSAVWPDVTKNCAHANPTTHSGVGPAVAMGRSPGGCGALRSYDYESCAAPTRLGRCRSYYTSRGCSAAPQRPRSPAWPQLASRRRCCSVFHTQYACTCLKAQLLRCHSPSAA